MKWFKNLFKVVEAPPKNEAERKLKQITELLYPPLELKVSPQGAKYQVDYSVDSNLDAALIDLEEGHNDKVAQNTIRNIANRLHNVRQLLDAYAEIDPEAKFLIVDDHTDDLAETIRDSESY